MLDLFTKIRFDYYFLDKEENFASNWHEVSEGRHFEPDQTQ
jgi:hypothetical protein